MEQSRDDDCNGRLEGQKEEPENDDLTVSGSDVINVEGNTTMGTNGTDPKFAEKVDVVGSASYWKTKYEEKEQFYKAERDAWDVELAAILDNLVLFENQLRLEQNEIVQFMNEKDMVVHRQTQHIKAILAVNGTLMEIMKKVNDDLHMNNVNLDVVRNHLDSRLNDMEALVLETKEAFNNHIQGLNAAHFNFQNQANITIPLEKNEESSNDYSRYISSHTGDVHHIKDKTDVNNSLANLKQTSKAISSKAPRKVIGKLKQLVTKSVTIENMVNNVDIGEENTIKDESLNSSGPEQRKVSPTGDIKQTPGITEGISPTARQRKVSVVHVEPLAIKNNGDQPEVWLPEKNINDQSQNQQDISLINSVAKNFGLEHKSQRESITSSLASTESDFDRDIELRGQGSTCTDYSDLDDDHYNEALLSEKEDTVGELVEHHRRISVEANAAVVGSCLDKGLTPREVKARDRIRSRSLPQTVNMQLYAQQFTNITDV